MKKVVVVTGGAGGMGFEAAKLTPKEKIVVIADIVPEKLEKAAAELKAAGIEAYGKVTDVSSRESVRELAEYAASLGEVTNVIHSAGVSPKMGNPEKILSINALGTIYMNEEFSKVMNKGSAIVDIASNSAHLLPDFLFPKSLYKVALKDEKKYLKILCTVTDIIPTNYLKAGLAYMLSKNFVVWYANKCAFKYGPRGIRVCSLSPGLIDTDMGKLESGIGDFLLYTSAESRRGKPEELGYAIMSVADEKNGYLAGVNVLVDGGATIGFHKYNHKGLLKFIKVLINQYLK